MSMCVICGYLFVYKQKSAYELRISDWSSDVCSSDLSLLLIEWPERLGAALWPHSLILDIATSPDGTRLLTATVPAAWKNRWPPIGRAAGRERVCQYV